MGGIRFPANKLRDLNIRQKEMRMCPYRVCWVHLTPEIHSGSRSSFVFGYASCLLGPWPVE